MESIVTARVPEEIKRQGTEILKSIGATPTDLVNSAFDYVIRYKKLPVDNTIPSGHRVLSEEQKAELKDILDRTTVKTSEKMQGDFLGGKTYKEFIAEGRAADYEALS